jgi:hypothetical protein
MTTCHAMLCASRCVGKTLAFGAHVVLGQEFNRFLFKSKNHPFAGMDGLERRGLRPRSHKHDVEFQKLVESGTSRLRNVFRHP